MAKLSSITKTATHRVCLFGPPKGGKTELAGRLAEHYNIIYIGMENGHATLMKLPQQWQERIEIVNIPDSRVFPIAIETALKIVKGTAVNICDTHGKVECPSCKKEGAPITRICLNEVGPDTVVIWDSLTQLTNSGIAHITKDKPDDYKLQLDDWGALRVLIDKFLSQIQVAKYNCVCITHEEEIKQEDGTIKIVPVSGSANSSRNTAKYFDHVIYCALKNKKHVVGSATNYAMSILTGSRTDVRLEDSGTASLLDIFTSWKLPGFGISETNTPADVTTSSVSGFAAGATGPEADTQTNSLTPGQQALANLRNKQAAK